MYIRALEQVWGTPVLENKTVFYAKNITMVVSHS
jgi:hypothetical protein